MEPIPFRPCCSWLAQPEINWPRAQSLGNPQINTGHLKSNDPHHLCQLEAWRHIKLKNQNLWLRYTILSPQSSDKELQEGWGTQAFSVFLPHHPQTMSSILKVPLASRGLLEHWHHLGMSGTREEEARKDEGALPPLKSFSKSSTDKLQLHCSQKSLHNHTELQGSLARSLCRTHGHPGLHQESVSTTTKLR